jgi:hypothetical protein
LSTGADGSTLGRRWAAFRDGLEEFYAGPYRRTFARARREEDDHFFLVVPAAYQGLELLPALYPEFHAWHRRIGLDRSPLEHVGCC